MSFERRITVAAAAAVAVAVLLAAVASYFIVRQELRSSVDNSLRSALTATERFVDRPLRYPPRAVPSAVAAHNDSTDWWAMDRTVSASRACSSWSPQAVRSRRAPGVSAGQTLPASPRLIALARRGTGQAIFTARVDGTDLRVLAAGVKPGGAIVLARSLSEQDSTLSHLRLILIVVAAIGIALAALLGSFVARTALAPVRHLRAAAEHVAATTDLGARIDDTRGDELGSLARSFNAMLAGTRRVRAHAAAADRRRLARAANTGDERADEPRDTCSAPTISRRRSASG